MPGSAGGGLAWPGGALAWLGLGVAGSASILPCPPRALKVDFSKLRMTAISIANQPACQPASLPACQPASQPTNQPASQPACQPASRPASHPASHPASLIYTHYIYRYPPFWLKFGSSLAHPGPWGPRYAGPKSSLRGLGVLGLASKEGQATLARPRRPPAACSEPGWGGRKGLPGAF